MSVCQSFYVSQLKNPKDPFYSLLFIIKKGRILWFSLKIICISYIFGFVRRLLSYKQWFLIITEDSFVEIFCIWRLLLMYFMFWCTFPLWFHVSTLRSLWQLFSLIFWHFLSTFFDNVKKVSDYSGTHWFFISAKYSWWFYNPQIFPIIVADMYAELKNGILYIKSKSQ